MNRTLLCTLLGIGSGVLAWGMAAPFIGGISGHTVHPNFTLGSFYGWFAHLMLGALLCGSLAGVLGYDRSGRWGAVRGVVLGAILGGALCAGADAFSDTLSINELRAFGENNIAGMASVGFIGLGRWCFFVAFSLSGAILLASGPTWDRIYRAFIAAVAATLLAFVARVVFDTVNGVASASQLAASGQITLESLQKHDNWQASTMAFLGEYVALGMVLGFAFGLVESVMKPAWLRQVYARNEWREWPVRKGITRIGSAEGIEITLADPGLAPVHAQVQLVGKTYTLVAFAPGVFLDGAPVVNSYLVPGQSVQIGAHGFLLGQGVARHPVAAPVYAPVAMAVAHRLVDPFGKVIPLGDGSYVIGREEGLPISIGFDSQASRRHAEILVSGAQAMVRDLGSTNGTFLDEVPVMGSVLLRDGATIRVGGTAFIYRSS